MHFYNILDFIIFPYPNTEIHTFPDQENGLFKFLTFSRLPYPMETVICYHEYMKSIIHEYFKLYDIQVIYLFIFYFLPKTPQRSSDLHSQLNIL